jgi:ATPase
VVRRSGGERIPLKIVPDTSVIIDGRITKLVEAGDYKDAHILVPEAVVAELEAQANKGRESGLAGLDELARLQDFAKTGKISLEFVGERPTMEAIELADTGEIDAMIRRVAFDAKAKLVTSDRILAAVAGAKGIDYSYIRPIIEGIPSPKDVALMRYFTPETMSVHLKVDCLPHAKTGTPGKITYAQVPGAQRLTHGQLTKMSNEIIEATRRDANSFVEIERAGCTVLQLGPMRIAICRPPFSDGLEITAVRPVKKLRLDEYKLEQQIIDRLTDYNRGVMISGPPGSGKSTLAQAVAEYLHEQNRVVKTMESPRDLQLPDDVTQYAPLEKDMALTGDVLLLVRPDFVIYDEVRRTEDFEVYADMRLAGIGLIGVTHANRAIDSIQRLIGRVELGMIPQVVDTVVHIEKGGIQQILEMKFSVRVPSGMTEADLARPVILVSDFGTKKELYEIYTYGEQVVVMPIEAKGKKKGTSQLAEDQLYQIAKGWVSGDVQVELVGENQAKVFVEADEIPRIIGKGGENIKRLEKEVGLSLDVVELPERALRSGGPKRSRGAEVVPNVVRTKKELLLYVEPEMANADCVVVVEGDDVFTGTISRKGEIRIRKSSAAGKRILDAHASGRSIKVRL